eukprot:CCRYP_000528-RA/>CCRYP_000528-RA protein AED:0.25 eAED:0.25 QI:141/1/1/1/0/0/2/1193/310
MTRLISEIACVGTALASFAWQCPVYCVDAFHTLPLIHQTFRSYDKNVATESPISLSCEMSPNSRSHLLSSALYSTMNSRRDDDSTTLRAEDRTIEVVPSTWKEALRRFFLGDLGPPLVVLSISGFILARFQLADTISVTDVTIFMLAIMFWWFQEYFFHRVLLHSPFEWIGKSIHRHHHEKSYFHVSIDPPALLLGWLFVAHFMLKAVLPWHLCLSATIGYSMAGLYYEWSHYIVHTRVKAPTPSQDNSFVGCISTAMSSTFSQMRDNHIRHHRVDDSYWYAFSIPAMDSLFATNPEMKEWKSRKSLTEG